MSFAFEVTRALIQHANSKIALRRVAGPDDGPYLKLRSPNDASQVTGFVEVLAGDGSHAVDRVLHIWFGGKAARVDTNLFWLFSKTESALPHYHAQAVHMPGDLYVYNFDLMPRVDLAVNEPYWKRVFGPLEDAHARFVRNPERAATRFPIPPSTGIHMSPWGIAGFHAPRAELEAAIPLWTMYLDRCLDLSTTRLEVDADVATLKRRDRALVAAHTSEEIDPRGWGGVARACGVEATERIKALMRGPLAEVVSLTSGPSLQRGVDERT